MTQQQKPWIKYLPWIGAAVGVVAFIAVALWIRSMIPDDSAAPKKMIQQITVITPPPPPPPPPEVKPPEPEEPEMKDEEVAEETPDEPMPDPAEDTPAGEDLGVDAEGGAGGDAFGLVGRKGGRGLLSGGAGGGYAAQGQRAINDAILEDKRLRRYQYRAILKVWFGSDGSVSRYEVDLASGDEEAKPRLAQLLSKLELGKPPPPDMKQPATYRVNSKL